MRERNALLEYWELGKAVFWKVSSISMEDQMTHSRLHLPEFWTYIQCPTAKPLGVRICHSNFTVIQWTETTEDTAKSVWNKRLGRMSRPEGRRGWIFIWNPSEQKVRGYKQEVKADDNKSNREINSTAKLEDIRCTATPTQGQFAYHIIQVSHSREKLYAEHRHTRVLTQTFPFTAFLVYFYTVFSKEKKLGRKKLLSFQCQCNGAAEGWKSSKLNFFPLKSKLIHQLLILERLVS